MPIAFDFTSTDARVGTNVSRGNMLTRAANALERMVKCFKLDRPSHDVQLFAVNAVEKPFHRYSSVAARVDVFRVPFEGQANGWVGRTYWDILSVDWIRHVFKVAQSTKERNVPVIDAIRSMDDRICIGLKAFGPDGLSQLLSPNIARGKVVTVREEAQLRREITLEKRRLVLLGSAPDLARLVARKIVNSQDETFRPVASSLLDTQVCGLPSCPAGLFESVHITVGPVELKQGTSTLLLPAFLPSETSYCHAGIPSLEGIEVVIDIPDANRVHLLQALVSKRRTRQSISCMNIINTLLGGFVGRVNSQLRHASAVDYLASAQIQKTEKHEIIFLNADVGYDDVNEARRGLDNAVVSLKNAPPASDDLSKALMGMIVAQGRRYESAVSMVDDVAARIYIDGAAACLSDIFAEEPVVLKEHIMVLGRVLVESNFSIAVADVRRLRQRGLVGVSALIIRPDEIDLSTDVLEVLS